MENLWWKVFALILCATLLFLAPLLNILERQDNIAYNVVFAECNRFADACRDTGYITPNMYQEFVERINSTGNTYEIKLFHINRTVIPVYTQTEGGLTFTGEYEVSHILIDEKEILDTLFPGEDHLEELNRYEFKMGDFFFVEVKNRGKTMATAVRDMILFSDTQTPSIFVRAGGMVRNEAY